MIELNSPDGPLRIQRDGNGYPSILARNPNAAAWAKGWIHARDRLGQVLLTRMAAQGRMMELLGDQPLMRLVDRAVRHLRIPSGIDDHVAALDDRATRLLGAYCAGFEEGRRSRLLDRTARLAGVDTRPYEIGDILLTHRMLCFFGLTSFQQIAEFLVGEIVHDGGDERLMDLLLGKAAAGIDLAAIRGMQIPDELALLVAGLGGSNAIAVSAERSASGGALLIADPHLEIGRFPPICYIVHEEYADGGYMQGLCVPGIPWLMMGRTRDVGIAYTYGHADNIDVLIERCERGRCERPDGWQTMRRRTERVKIRGAEEDEIWTYWDNDFGSIASDSADGDLPCVRWAGLHESTGTDVNALVSFPTMRTVEELVEGHRNLHVISLGAVFADREGNIAWVHTGRVDARPGEWTGAYPEPGWTYEGSPEALPESARPVLVNPEDGIIAAANEQVDGMNGERWVNFPEPLYRVQRLREQMARIERPALRDLVAACLDETDTMVLRFADTWRRLLADRDFDKVARWAGGQDHGTEDARRENLGLFHALHHEVVRALLQRWISPDSATRILDELGGMLCFQNQLDDALALERLDLLSELELQELLQEAWPKARKLVASDRWNVPVRGRFKSIFDQGALPGMFGFSSEVVDFPGGPTSPFQTRVMPYEGELMVGGPAARYCCDMSDHGGWYHVPGGAAELPWGPGYGTGIRQWQLGKFTALGRPAQAAPNLVDR